MNKAFKIIIKIFAIILFQGCGGNDPDLNDIPTITIDHNKPVVKIRLSDLDITDLKWVPLETGNDFLLSDILQIKTTDSAFFIIDNRALIFHFDINGKFVGQIGRLGYGPGEYVMPHDFTVDKEAKQVFLLPLRTNPKLKVYDFNGKYLHEVQAPSETRKIAATNGFLLCWVNELGKDDFGITENIHLIDNRTGEVKKSFNKKYYLKQMSYPHNFLSEFYSYNFNGLLHIKEFYSDSVFCLKGTDLQPTFVLDHGGKTINPTARETIINRETLWDVDYNYSKEVKIMQFGNFVYSEFLWQRKLYCFVGSLAGKKTFLFDQETGIINDWDGGPKFRPFATITDQTFLACVNAFELKMHVASDAFKNSTPKFREKKKELEELANSLDENDNPVLMIVKLKE